MARSRIREMNWASENHEEALQLFKQTMSYYCEDEDITDPGKIALKVLRGIGNEGLKRLKASGMSDADKKRPDKIWELFESQLKTNLNFRVHRLQLMDYRQRSEGSSPTGLCRHWKPAGCDNPDSSSANPTGNSLCHPSRA